MITHQNVLNLNYTFCHICAEQIFVHISKACINRDFLPRQSKREEAAENQNQKKKPNSKCVYLFTHWAVDNICHSITRMSTKNVDLLVFRLPANIQNGNEIINNIFSISFNGRKKKYHAIYTICMMQWKSMAGPMKHRLYDCIVRKKLHKIWLPGFIISVIK